MHELGHHYEESHLSEGFHASQTSLGVKLAFLAAEQGPGIWSVKNLAVKA